MTFAVQHSGLKLCLQPFSDCTTCCTLEYVIWHTRNKCYCTCVLPGSTVDGWMHDSCLGGASILDLLWYISRVQILRKNLRKWERAELEFVMRARALYKLEALGCTDSHFFAGNHILLTSWENLSKHKMSICTFGNAPLVVGCQNSSSRMKKSPARKNVLQYSTVPVPGKIVL